MPNIPLSDDNICIYIREKLEPAIRGLFSRETGTLPVDILSEKGKGLRSYVFAETHKNDLPVMLRCCEEELNNLMTIGRAPSSYYFERAAILARKEKNFELEVKICEALIKAYAIYEEAYKNQGKSTPANTAYTSEEMNKRLMVARKSLEPHQKGFVNQPPTAP
jgi:hypothetical protein